MKPAKNIFRNAFALLLVAVLIAGACSSNGGKDSNIGENGITTSQTATSSSAPASVPTLPETQDETSFVVSFIAGNGSGTIAISGDNSLLLAWFANQSGEVSLDLANADVTDAVSVVEELVSFWFFSDDDSGDVPPSIFESASGDINDSFGTRYVIEAQGLPPAPGTETTTSTTTTTTSSTTSTTSSLPSETSELPSTTTTTSTTTATPAITTTSTTTTTVPVVEDLSPAQLVVQVLNGSGIAGAAGRLSANLEDAGYEVLPAGNAPERFASSAVYYVALEHRDEAELVAEVVAESVDDAVDGVSVASLPASGQVPAGSANVVVLIGRDELGGGLRTAERSSGLRRTPDSGTQLPLSSNVPRDRFVPGLADIQIFTPANDQGSDDMKGILNALSGWFNVAGRYMALAERRAGHLPADLEDNMDYAYLQNEVWPNIERSLEWLGFTPQNVCGAPAEYSFTDLIKPTREFDPQTQNYTGDAILTTDRLIELHGGERINPEVNLDFYIRQAVQTTHDYLRDIELRSETETMQLILCRAWLAPEGKIPVTAHVLFKSGFIPGVQPLESLLSQGTYHVREISRNGNIAHVVVCHPTLRERHVLLHWREAGYRAEVLAYSTHTGCQGTFEGETSISEDSNGAEDTFRFAFGERVFSAGDLQGFPRASG